MLSPSRSVALPLPSSPHWAPTRTIAGMGRPLLERAKAPRSQARPGPLADRGYPIVRGSITFRGFQAPRTGVRAGLRGAGPVLGWVRAESDRTPRCCRRPDPRPTGSVGEGGRRGRAGVAQEVRASNRLVVLTDRGGCQTERVQAPEKAAIRFVLPRHWAVTLPAGAAQLVERSVIASAGVGVGGDGFAAGQRPIRQLRPGSGVARMI